MGLRAFFQQRREAKKKAKFEAGYDWAAGTLLSKRMPQEEVEIYAGNTFDRDEFDDGAVQAIRDYSGLEAAAVKVQVQGTAA